MAEHSRSVRPPVKRVIAVAVVMLLASTATATAATLYTAAHQHAGGLVKDPFRFEAIVGYPKQCVTGIPCWTYTKGTRSANAHWPESWYLHVNGVRVRDKKFNLYVMDPRSAGWQHQVAKTCSARCFVDGLGASSINRTQPRLAWSTSQWVNAVARVVAAVHSAGKLVLPNSVGHNAAQGAALVAAAGGRGSTEGFLPGYARATLNLGHIWVQERGNCLAKYAAYLKYRQRGDHFSCYEWGTLPWDTSWLP